MVVEILLEKHNAKHTIGIRQKKHKQNKAIKIQWIVRIEKANTKHIWLQGIEEKSELNLMNTWYIQTVPGKFLKIKILHYFPYQYYKINTTY